jgi:dTDP-D-glucose 4,6-dehydratase
MIPPLFAGAVLSYEVGVDFKEGIRRTVVWYVENLVANQSICNREQ